MTEAQEIYRNLKFLEEVRKLVHENVLDGAAAHGAVCTLTLVAIQISNCLCKGDAAETRDMMVDALNLGLKHGIK